MTQKARVSAMIGIGMVFLLMACTVPASQAQEPAEILAPMETAVPAEVPAPVSPLELRERPRDLSLRGMIEEADLVVKSVMAWLGLCAFLTWVILIAKGLETLGASAAVRNTAHKVATARTLGEAAGIVAGRRNAPARLVEAAVDEVRASAALVGGTGGAGLLDRVHSRLARMQAGAARKLARGTGLLATIGATAPFIGLFGTVWGIMNAFIGISEAKTTNLAVVAPGIAEALLATAMGLVAAIPAVIFYNIFSRANGGYRHDLVDLAAALERLVSRDIDSMSATTGGERS